MTSRLIHSITLHDFRSYDVDTVELDEVTCLIGANESGKTNLLTAINLALLPSPAEKDDKRLLKDSDTRKLSLSYRAQKLPKIEYKVSAGLISNPTLSEAFRTSGIAEITLVRDGNTLKVEIPPLLRDAKILKNVSAQDIILSVSDTEKEAPGVSTSDSREPSSDPMYSETPVTIPPNGIVLATSLHPAYSVAIEKHVTDGFAKRLEADAAGPDLEALLLADLKRNLRLFFWSYDPNKYSLPDMIPIAEITPNIDAKPLIRALFKLGGYTPAQIPSILEGRTDHDYVNIYQDLSAKVTAQVREKWRTNDRLKIQVLHQPDHLVLTIEEPGYSIEPKYRSDGMRWFLGFVIGMVAQADELKDHLILIDEPALYLHPGGQKDVLKEINKLALDNQVVYSTHSHFMIDKRYPSRVRFMIKGLQNGYSLTKVSKPTKIDIFRDPLLRAALLFSVSDVSYINEMNVLVEGTFDKKVISLVATWLADHGRSAEAFDLNTTSIIDCGGASDIVRQARSLKPNGLKCLSLYDSDTLGTKYNRDNAFQDTSEKLEIKDITNTDGTTFEDLIPEAVFAEALTAWNPTGTESIAIPRMRGIDLILERRLQQSNTTDSEKPSERKRVKHELEDAIVETLERRINQLDEAQLSSLTSLIRQLNERLGPMAES